MSGTYQFHDGGRVEAGFKGTAGDCVPRAFAIALDLPYREVYDDLAAREKAIGKPRSARNGVDKKVCRSFMADHGWDWTPTMGIGTGCQVHVRADELPTGRLALQLSKHVTAVVDGVVYDTYDPTRGGTRCVYGYWSLPVG